MSCRMDVRSSDGGLSGKVVGGMDLQMGVTVNLWWMGGGWVVGWM